MEKRELIKLVTDSDTYTLMSTVTGRPYITEREVPGYGGRIKYERTAYICEREKDLPAYEDTSVRKGRYEWKRLMYDFYRYGINMISFRTERETELYALNSMRVPAAYYSTEIAAAAALSKQEGNIWRLKDCRDSGLIVPVTVQDDILRYRAARMNGKLLFMAFTDMEESTFVNGDEWQMLCLPFATYRRVCMGHPIYIDPGSLKLLLSERCLDEIFKEQVDGRRPLL